MISATRVEAPEAPEENEDEVKLPDSDNVSDNDIDTDNDDNTASSDAPPMS